MNAGLPSEASQWESRGNLENSADRSRWVIVLAGGDGDRMRPFIQGWLGEPRPKQYCTFVGKRSMLRHTIDRATALVPPGRVITVVSKNHRAFLGSEARSIEGRVIEQPRNCGTAAGIFLPVTYIMAEDPDATVLILPSDHFTYPESTFLCYALGGFLLAETRVGGPILLGARATRPETDYGWIKPSRKGGVSITGGAAWSLATVDYFREKPSLPEATELLSQGCLWNTMIVASKARILWSLGWQLLPGMMERFHAFQRVLCEIRSGQVDASEEDSALQDAYAGMQTHDFSRDMLQKAAPWIRVLAMKRVSWCDWGRPERIISIMERLSLQPTSPFLFSDGLRPTTIS